MSHAQCTWLDRIPVPPRRSTPSLPYPLNGSITCNPQHGVQFGRLAEQSPIAGYESNDPVEDNSTEVTTILLPLRRACIGSTYNSGEDIATTPPSSEFCQSGFACHLCVQVWTEQSEERLWRSRGGRDLHQQLHPEIQQ